MQPGEKGKAGEIERGDGRANLFLLPQPKLAGEEFKKEMKDKVFRQKSQTLYRVTIMDGKKPVLSPGILWAVTVATNCPGKQMHVNRGFLSPCIIKLGSRKPNLELFRQLETSGYTGYLIPWTPIHKLHVCPRPYVVGKAGQGGRPSGSGALASVAAVG